MMILKAMKTIGSPIHLTLVGSGGMEQELKDYAREQGIGPQLVFAGQVI